MHGRLDAMPDTHSHPQRHMVGVRQTGGVTAVAATFSVHLPHFIFTLRRHTQRWWPACRQVRPTRLQDPVLYSGEPESKLTSWFVKLRKTTLNVSSHWKTGTSLLGPDTCPQPPCFNQWVEHSEWDSSCFLIWMDSTLISDLLRGILSLY